MKKKYSEVGVGELFQLPNRSQEVYMKIDHEQDHNYFYVSVQGKCKGRCYSPLEDDFMVTSVEVISGKGFWLNGGQI